MDTYVFGGKYDAQCPIEFSYEIANLIPTSDLTIFEQSNHNPFIEEEQAFMDFVKKLLKMMKKKLIQFLKNHTIWDGRKK